MPNDFALDIARIRDEARKHIKEGALMPTDTTNVAKVIDVLNKVVASEMTCYLRYTQNAIVCQGINREQVAAMFVDHANEELGHFLRVSDRINQLGGTPDLDPATMKARAITDYIAPSDETDLQSMIRENLIGERSRHRGLHRDHSLARRG